MKSRINLPTALSLTRLGLAPIFAVVYLFRDTLDLSITQMVWTLIVIGSVAEFTDWLDGYLARRTNRITDLGKVVDPMADAVFKMTIFFSFTQFPINVPVILVLFLFYRESLVTTLRTVCALRGIALAARPSGKVKTVFQAIAALLILLALLATQLGYFNVGLKEVQSIAFWLTLFITLISLGSAIEYFIVNRHHLKASLDSK